MSKYYLSDSNSATDQSVAQSMSERDPGYAILLNSSQVRFFKNGTHIKNLNWSGGYSQPTKSKFSSLGTAFTKFFSGDNPGGTSASNNAFSYMSANKNDAVVGGWPV